MRKIALFLAPLFVTTPIWADFNANLTQTYNSKSKIKIESIDNLTSFDAKLVIITKEDEGMRIPLLTSKDGKSYIVLPSEYNLSQRDNDLIKKRITFGNNIEDAAAYELLKTVPQERFIEINSLNKNHSTTIYLVTDPECEACKEDINKIEEYIKRADVKITFAPIHGISAYTKAAIVLKKAKKIDPNNQEAIIKILKKYFDKEVAIGDDEVTKEEKQEILENSKAIYSKGVIKGVPYRLKVQK
ncbi:hypothetical protein [uncultured Campylobacter sp.]|uniref:hypothetical protein n=1 Tax=uncultured Campylobacter sp. TaxID=218934 RepID=UPI0026084B56|nr:hypothetical protein [uncultured Campylobacter sp.]